MAIPVGVIVAVAVAVARPGAQVAAPPITVSNLFPWVLLLAGAVALESAGLALGGRSRDVPTLSTVIDHLLGSHGARFVLFACWLLVWVEPVRARFRRFGAIARGSGP